MHVTQLLRAALCGATMLGGLAATPLTAQEVVGLITKTEGNPFFVKMREGAQEAAADLGLELRTFAGDYDGDNESQVAAIESLIAAGALGFALVANDPTAIVPTVQQARDAGLFVIALDTPLDPIDAADATFATDNREAGRLIGAWAAATLGDEAENAVIALLNGHVNQTTIDYLRNQGFLAGFGVDVGDPDFWGDEDDPRICGFEASAGAEEGGRTGMETLLQRCPDINVVYTVNEPTAAGAWEALRAAGRDDGSVLVVSVDGGCPGVQNVADGVIGATSQQYPLLMASMAMEAIAAYAADGTLPETAEGLDFFDTGAALVTDAPVEGVPSIDSAEGEELCWG